MLPIFDPAVTMFEPVVLGMLELAAVGVAGMAAVLGLVVLAERRPTRSRAAVSRLRPHLPEAA